jgi:hypothetical protein
MAVKYIRTDSDQIVVFGEYYLHSEFESFKPRSAGFISFGVDKDNNPTCTCYGESVSLKLKSDPEKDSALAKKQILNL